MTQAEHIRKYFNCVSPEKLKADLEAANYDKMKKVNSHMLSPTRKRMLEEQAKRGNYIYGGWVDCR